MRINHLPDTDDLPPPPYTPTNPSPAVGEVPLLSQDAGSLPYQPTLRGGYTRPSFASESHVSSEITYVEDRQPYLRNAGSHTNLIEHNITISPDTTREDIIFPLPIETYVARDITSLDWSTFVNSLFPAPKDHSTEKPRREKDRNPRAFAEEDTPERRSHIEAVVADWNRDFFSPRLIHVNVEFGRPSSSSSKSTTRPTSTLGITPSETSLNRDFSQPETRYTLPPKQDFSAQPLHRTLSRSSTSSSSSSSSSSTSTINSIKSKDYEGADINSIRSALLAFRLDLANKRHLRSAIRNLGNEFRSQRRTLFSSDRRDLKKEYKEERKEIKKEVKAVVNEFKAARKADRKLHKAERKSRREGKRAEHRTHHHAKHLHEKSKRKADERAMRAQDRTLDAQDRAAENVSQAHHHAREAQARAAASVSRAHAQAAEAIARSRESEKAARERAGGVDDRAWRAEARAHETARNYGSRRWGDEATARAQQTAQSAAGRDWGCYARAGEQTAREASARDWGSYGRERARDAQGHARDRAGQDWGRYGRERAREAEGRAREAARGPGRSGRQDVDGDQESGVLG